MIAAPTPRRVVVCYDVSGGRVVKGVSFVELQDQGAAEALLAAGGAHGADEVILLDIEGGRGNRELFLATVRSAAAATDLPLVVGGGVRSLADAQAAFAAGATKVAVNSAFVKEPDLIDQLVGGFGSQRVVASIDARSTTAAASGAGSQFEVFIGGGRQATGLAAVAWAQKCAARGIGEILLTSIDRDGRRSGFDLELTGAVASAVTVPVTASGGAGSAEHFVQLFSSTVAAAGLAAGSIHDGTITAAEVKSALRQAGIPTTTAPQEYR